MLCIKFIVIYMAFDRVLKHLPSLLQLEDGDIICFQKSTPIEGVGKFRYPEVPSFLDYVHNRQVCILVSFYIC